MRVNTYVQCHDFPCSDVRHAGYQVPGIDLRPEQVSILLISEAAPAIPGDGYYAGAGALFEQTTVQAYLLIPLIPRPLLPPGECCRILQLGVEGARTPIPGGGIGVFGVRSTPKTPICNTLTGGEGE